MSLRIPTNSRSFNTNVFEVASSSYSYKEQNFSIQCFHKLWEKLSERRNFKGGKKKSTFPNRDYLKRMEDKTFFFLLSFLKICGMRYAHFLWPIHTPLPPFFEKKRKYRHEPLNYNKPASRRFLLLRVSSTNLNVFFTSFWSSAVVLYILKTRSTRSGAVHWKYNSSNFFFTNLKFL